MAGKFKKGESGNPKGPTPLPPDIRAAHKLTKTMILEILTQYLSTDLNSLRAMAEDPTKPVLHHIVARIALLAIENGDHQRLNFFCDRLIGKVTDKVEHTMPRPVRVDFGDGTGVYLGAEKKEDE